VRGVHKTSIARIVECTPDTLYRWMEDNGLRGYMNSRSSRADGLNSAGTVYLALLVAGHFNYCDFARCSSTMEIACLYRL